MGQSLGELLMTKLWVSQHVTGPIGWNQSLEELFLMSLEEVFLLLESCSNKAVGKWRVAPLCRLKSYSLCQSCTVTH
jgi:hypothetical protein